MRPAPAAHAPGGDTHCGASLGHGPGAARSAEAFPGGHCLLHTPQWRVWRPYHYATRRRQYAPVTGALRSGRRGRWTCWRHERRTCMRVLIACEFSGVVRQAFAALGHDAWSCDLLPSEQAGHHIQGDVMTVLEDSWDLMIAHPPCTYLCNSGARWWAQRQPEQAAALTFVQTLLDAPIPRIALENPQGCISTRLRKASQMIHPWEYGEPYEKQTCLWLKNLPLLQATKLMWPREQRCWRMGQSVRRAQERARTYAGIAAAMAQQWSLSVLAP